MTQVFHESFDSTRATADDPPDHPNLAQAQAEALISLLLGRTVVVVGSYALDSRSLLELVEVVLDTRARARRESPAAACSRIDNSTPFIVYWYPANDKVHDLFSACQDQLRRTDPIEKRFVLSAWKPIDRDVQARAEVAAALHSGERSAPPRSLDPELVRLFDALVRLEDYSRTLNRCRKTRVSHIGLATYLTHLEQMPRPKLHTLAQEWGCPSELAETLQEEILSRHLDTGTRTWAHTAMERAARYHEPGLALLVRQLVDTLYNAVLADSAYADSSYLSSVPRLDGRAELKQVNALAVGLVRDTHDAHAGYVSTAPSTKVSGVFAQAETLPYMSAQPLTALFEAYWQLIADDDACHVWRESCGRLERLLALGTNTAGPFREAWESHLDMLKMAIPGVTADQGRLAIGARRGQNTYTQTHQTEGLDPATLRAALAASEYLDQLARGETE